jgi:DNA-binding PadR family transcriptional regulator
MRNVGLKIIMESYEIVETKLHDVMTHQTLSETYQSDLSISELNTGVRKMTLFDLQILSLLSSVPMTGYSLRRSLLSYFSVKVSFGTLYPRLRHFEKKGLLRSTIVHGHPGNRVIEYELTLEGEKVLGSGLTTFQRSMNNMIDLVARTSMVDSKSK